jgi:hypothetical protein
MASTKHFAVVGLLLLTATVFAGSSAPPGPTVNHSTYVNYERISSHDYSPSDLAVYYGFHSQAQEYFVPRPLPFESNLTDGDKYNKGFGQVAIYFILKHPKIRFPELNVLYDPNYWREQIKPLLPSNPGIGRNKHNILT